MRHNCESKQTLRNKVAAKILAEQQAASMATADTTNASTSEAAQCATPADGTTTTTVAEAIASIKKGDGTTQGAKADLTFKKEGDNASVTLTVQVDTQDGPPDHKAHPDEIVAGEITTKVHDPTLAQATTSTPTSPKTAIRALAADGLQQSCAVTDDSRSTTPLCDRQCDEEAALEDFPLHTQSSASRFTDNLPPSLASPINATLASNVPNDSTTSTVLVDSEGIVRPVGIQPTTNNIFESIKDSRSQSFSRFKEDAASGAESSKTMRSNSGPSSTKRTSTPASKDADKENQPVFDATLNTTDVKPKHNLHLSIDDAKKEQLAQQARLRAIVKFQERVEMTVHQEYIQPWNVRAVFNKHTSDETMLDFQQKMQDMAKRSFNDEQFLAVVKVDLEDADAVDGIMQGAEGVFLGLFDKRGLPCPEVLSSGKVIIGSAHRNNVDHLIVCSVADLECDGDLPLPRSIADTRAIRELLDFQSLEGQPLKEDLAPVVVISPASSDTKEASTLPPLPKSPLFKYCTILAIAIPFECYLSQKVFRFVKKPASMFEIETHIPVDEWFPFSCMRDVGPFAMQAFLAPDVRETHIMSLVSDFTCLKQATHQAGQIIYHSNQRVSCGNPSKMTPEIFLGPETKKWYEAHDLSEVYDLLTWWILSKAAKKFWDSGRALPGRNKLSAWRHYVYDYVDSVLPGWKEPESQWKSVSATTYQFNLETPTFSHRYAKKSTKAASQPKTSSAAGETPQDELDMLNMADGW